MSPWSETVLKLTMLILILTVFAAIVIIFKSALPPKAISSKKNEKA
ncbi:MAG: hypothetical protein KGI11_08185 [Thaumarchaeota archaeon]|nr:hypothetical protein [Nitrososphaerota archaeon]